MGIMNHLCVHNIKLLWQFTYGVRERHHITSEETFKVLRLKWKHNVKMCIQNLS